jgi:phage baseplate assembly protein W
MADFPHISLPFRFEQAGGPVVMAVTEEDSLDEIGDCVELILRTEHGQRRTLPGFGRPEQLLFMTDRELARSLVQAAVDEWEGRVQATVERADLDPNDPGLLRLRAMYELPAEHEELIQVEEAP